MSRISIEGFPTLSRAERAKLKKIQSSMQPASIPLTFSASAEAASGSSAKKRQRNSQPVVRSSAKKHRPTKPKPVAEGRIMVLNEDGQQVKRSCRLLNQKKKKL